MFRAGGCIWCEAGGANNDKSSGPGGMMAGADFFKLSAGAKKEAVKAEKIYKHGRLKSIC
jgi:hypothetical protein